jgi:hypothetical protein
LNQVNWRWLDWQHQNGKVAMICSSFDSAVLTRDLLAQNKVVTACGALIENSLVTEIDNLQLYREQLLSILQELESLAEIKVIILNIWDIEAVNREIVQTIVNYCQVLQEVAGATPKEQIQVKEEIKQSGSSVPYFVLRLLNHTSLNDLPLCEQIYLSSSLEESINQAIAVVKSS